MGCLEGVCWWCGVSSSLTKTASHGGVVQQELDDGCGMMDSRRVVALSDVVVTSSAGSAKFMQISTLKIARWSDGGDGFFSVYTRCSLRVC